MKHSKIIYTTFDNITLPKTVYKYRQANNPIHLNFLEEPVLYFAPPASFEDKFDCKIPVRYDLLTEEEIYDKYYNELKAEHPNWDPVYLRDEVIRWCNRGLLTDKNRLAVLEEHFWNELNERFGVLSLTAINDNHLMWKKYSSSYNGFCIGFDPKIIFRDMGGGGPVEYVKKLPIIMPFDTPEKVRLTLSLTKLEKWSFEKEYRVQKFWPSVISDNERKFKINPVAITEIIFGNRINKSKRDYLIDSARKINPALKIYIAEHKLGGVSIKSFA